MAIFDPDPQLRGNQHRISVSAPIALLHACNDFPLQARAHGQYQMREPDAGAQQAVTWARDHVFERSAVQDRRAILETALARGMGEISCAAIQSEFERRIGTGEFREIDQSQK